MKRICIALAALAFILSAFGCGQSGPLYLPGDPSRMETVEPASEDTEEEAEKDEESPSE